jgi:hypothetical protein
MEISGRAQHLSSTPLVLLMDVKLPACHIMGCLPG